MGIFQPLCWPQGNGAQTQGNKERKVSLENKVGDMKGCVERMPSPAPRVRPVLVAAGMTCSDGVASPGLAASLSAGICPSFWDVIFLSWKLPTNVLRHATALLWLPAGEGISQRGRHRNLVEMARSALRIIWEMLAWLGRLCRAVPWVLQLPSVAARRSLHSRLPFP